MNRIKTQVFCKLWTDTFINTKHWFMVHYLLTFHLNEVQLFNGTGDTLVVQGKITLWAHSRWGRHIFMPCDVYIGYPVDQHWTNLFKDKCLQFAVYNKITGLKIIFDCPGISTRRFFNTTGLDHGLNCHWFENTVFWKLLTRHIIKAQFIT